MNRDACVVLLPIFVQSIPVGPFTWSLVRVSSVSNSAKWLRPREDPRSKSLRWGALKVFTCGARRKLAGCFGLLAGSVEVKIWDQRFWEGKVMTVWRNALIENTTPALLLSSEADCTWVMLQLRAGLIIYSEVVLCLMNFHYLKTAQCYHKI